MERWIGGLLAAAGLEAEASAAVATSLVDASLRGVDSHGVARTTIYVDRLRAGGINGGRGRRSPPGRGDGARRRRRRPGPGRGRSSPPTSRSSSRASTGPGSSAARCSSHYGAAAYYTRRAAAAGMVRDVVDEQRPAGDPLRRHQARARHEPDLARRAVERRHLRPRHGHEPGRDQQDLQRARRGPHDPGGLGRRRGAASRPRTRPRSPPASRSAATRATRSRCSSRSCAACCPARASRTASAGSTATRPKHQDVGHFHLAMDPERTIGRDRFAMLLEGMLAESGRSRPPRVTTRCCAPATRSFAPARSASATASPSSPRCCPA